MTELMPAAPDHSMLGLFMQADIVVKAVMLLLLLASIACWAIVVDKIFVLRRLKREATAVEAATARPGLPSETGLLPLGSHMVQRGLAAWRDSDQEESRKDRRERIERAMRAGVGAYLRKVEPGLPFLATLGSAAPFIGLFGTVWGIMNSFTAIAQSNDTSLAVVAPGIAEALLATALGLVAAIPAVIAYNKFATDLGRIGQRFNACIGILGERLTASDTSGVARSHAAE
ncbi:MotA/TolQ/ExbB proton channel family protein [Ferrovibrio sp.]|uniref:MotA/TolQ/ExbB proton channel family protein n=1 Tax=Ferrovibrio sp. TaxID=1917215 RepID=UPI0035B4CCE8